MPTNATERAGLVKLVLPIGTLERVEGKKQQSIKCPGKPMCAICIAPAPGWIRIL
jgi:hypothetical protein